jgi:glycosyltransferase involved in cell wall biosynthesis
LNNAKSLADIIIIKIKEIREKMFMLDEDKRQSLSPETVEKPFVTVIVPTYNDRRHLQTCLNALKKQNFPKGQYEVLIVDNGSSQPPRDVVASYGNGCKLLHESKRGSYAARNKAIRYAKGIVLAFTDTDCIPDPNWLKCGVDAVISNRQIGLVGGRIKTDFVAGVRRNMYSLYDYCFAFPQDLYVNKGQFAATANMFTRMDVIERVGAFDDELMSSGDKAWGNKVYNAGLRVQYAEDAVVIHPPRDSFLEHRKKIVRVARGLEVYHIRYGGLQKESPSYFNILKHEIRLVFKLLRSSYSILFTEKRLPLVNRCKVYMAMWVIKHTKLIETIKVQREIKSSNRNQS